ncbi:MAG: hypothetical protein ACRD4E_04030 [Bryobacteraceae bacterium]
MNRSSFIFSMVTIAGSCAAQIPTDLQRLLEAADRQVVRLNPAAFHELPKNLLAELKRRGCTVPQVPMIEGRQNVIKGEFAKPGQTDWAVLCSVNRISSILIFWNGSGANPSDIATMKDVDRLQGWGDDRLVYSRAITPVGKAYIFEHYEAYGGPKPPPIDHQGIDDAFVGKASVVNYFFQGKWLQLTGAD